MLKQTFQNEDVVNHIVALVSEKEYDAAIDELTKLSHRNLSYLNTCIDTLIAKTGLDNAFALQLKLFVSEQKLNEQKIIEAEQLLQDIIAKNETSGNLAVQIQAELQLAIVAIYRNDLQKANELFLQCEEQATSASNKLLQIEVSIYGYHLYSENNIVKASAYIFQALHSSVEIGDTYKQAYCLLHIGTLNTILKKYDTALNYLQQSYQLFASAHLNLCMADNLMCQFNIYYHFKNYESMITCLNQAIQLGSSSGWDHKVALCYGNLSTAYSQLKEFEKARQAAAQDVAISIALNNANNIGASKFRMAKIEFALGNYYQAAQLFNESMEVRKQSISQTQLSIIYFHLYPCYQKLGDYKQAFETQAAYMDFKFKLIDEASAKEQEKLRALYEAEKREAELRESRLQQTESELKALKAQMNPHFIFNALNSIQEIFFLGDKRLANKHLARFSQLMRSILRASGKKTITLQEEITMLEEYLTLEALRFGTLFSFQVLVDENVDTYTLDVPPMIIQPFVENAVKHGLLHKTGEQKIEINFDFNEERNIITATVSDNGIGRKASGEINKHRNKHESFSTSATQKRFDILNQQANESFLFAYHDLENENGESIGTKVTIIIPV